MKYMSYVGKQTLTKYLRQENLTEQIGETRESNVRYEKYHRKAKEMTKKQKFCPIDHLKNCNKSIPLKRCENRN